MTKQRILKQLAKQQTTPLDGHIFVALNSVIALIMYGFLQQALAGALARIISMTIKV